MTTTILYSRTYANSETSTEVNPTKRYYLKDEQGNDIEDKWFEYKLTNSKANDLDGNADGVAITDFSENFGDTLTIPDNIIQDPICDIFVFYNEHLKAVVLNNSIQTVYFAWEGNSGEQPQCNVETVIVGDGYLHGEEANTRLKKKDWGTVCAASTYRLENLKNMNVLDDCKTYQSKDGILYTSDMKKVVACPSANNVKVFKTDDTVSEIGKYAFYRNYSLEKVVLNDNVKRIPAYAFAECDNLTKVKGGKGLKTIGYNAFWNSSLKNIKLYKGLKEIGGGAFSTTDIKKIVVPKTVLWMGRGAFSHSSLVSAKINSKKLDYSEFRADAIDTSWFEGCFDLKTVEFSSAVTRIPEYTFFDCTSLKKVKFSKKLKIVESLAFANCKKLKQFKFKGNPKIKEHAIGYMTEQRIAVKEKIRGVTIRAKQGTRAQKYAKKNGLKFKVLKK